MSRFQFKHFELEQDNCAMKIGTDGVLLGAWAAIAQASSILDIGTGTGVLALMAAQRNPTAVVHAVEINFEAQQQAKANFERSPWAERLSLLPYAVQDYAAQQAHLLYDSLLCNPPYYPAEKNSTITNKARRQARSTVNLDFATLLDNAQQLLKTGGNFSLILPHQEAQYFLTLAESKDWFIATKVAVYPRVGKATNRTLLCLQRTPCTTQVQELFLRPINGGRQEYTADFEALHRDFLLFL